MPASVDSSALLTALEAAQRFGQLTAGAVQNLRTWIKEPAYRDFLPQVAEHVTAGKWKTLDDVFWTIIPFGTGGRRGMMYPIGSNAINDRTIGESAQGLADYVLSLPNVPKPLSCAIAYDTRHRSREFAELCAEILVAAGFTIYFLDGYRSTPELSFAVRHKRCTAGIMVTASHNPPSDNAVKVYWSTGGQLLPPHDKGVIGRVQQVQEIKRVPFAQALADGRVVYCQQEVDAAFLGQVAAQALPGPRELKVLYSPLHGVGGSAAPPALAADGFKQVEIFGPHANPDGDFPNVPHHVSNPENPEVFDALIARCKEIGADLAIATDPDCDRVGCAAPLTKNLQGPWGTFTGNQIGALLAEFVLARRKQAGSLSPEHYVAKTLVTTEMIRRIADAYGVKTYGDLLVGFKWIAGLIDEVGPAKYVLGCEESHGYQVGSYTRDKDAAVASMLLAELAAACKAAGQTLHEKLDSLFWQYGCHAEQTSSVTMPGSEGMARMQTLMSALRANPPKELGGQKVTRVRDYGNLKTLLPDGRSEPLVGPKGDMVLIDLAEGNYVAVRPSGTEPKVKFYLFAYEPAEQLANLEDTKTELKNRLAGFARDLKAYAEKV